MPKILIIATLTAALSFGLLALVPAERQTSSTAPDASKTQAASIDL